MPARRKDAHKGDFGRVLVVAGSVGMAGAGCLAAEAALRSGCGLVRLATPERAHPQAASRLASIMTAPLPQTGAGTAAMGALAVLRPLGRDAVLVGPGMGRNRETDLFIRDFAAEVSCPLVVDADGLAAAGGNPGVLSKAGRPLVLTPHPGEMARLTGIAIRDIQSDRRGSAEELARKVSCVVVLKGAGTVVTDGSRTRINRTGNPGMATAGSGDVLAGIVVSLLGQGFGAFEAAVLAAHVHGLAGDIAAEEMGMASMTADDLLRMLPAAFRRMRP